MKLVLFENPGEAEPRPGLLTERGIVDIGGHVAQSYTPQLTMQGIIDEFERLRPVLDQLAADGERRPAAGGRLHPPLPRPGKILCCIGNYWEHAQREPRPLNMFMKNPEAVVGPGDTIRLPKLTEPWIFMHEAELALVIKGPAKEVRREDWRKAIFGYTGLIDVSARGEGRRTWKAGSWLGKSFDTFAPIRQPPKPSKGIGRKALAKRAFRGRPGGRGCGQSGRPILRGCASRGFRARGRRSAPITRPHRPSAPPRNPGGAAPPSNRRRVP